MVCFHAPIGSPKIRGPTPRARQGAANRKPYGPRQGLPKRPRGRRIGSNRPIGGRDLSQTSDMSEHVDNLQAGPAIVGVAPELSGPNATDRGLGKLRLAERINLAECHRAAVAA